MNTAATNVLAAIKELDINMLSFQKYFNNNCNTASTIRVSATIRILGGRIDSSETVATVLAQCQCDQQIDFFFAGSNGKLMNKVKMSSVNNNITAPVNHENGYDRINHLPVFTNLVLSASVVRP